ncbi:MAG: hypothetical protein A3G34_00445 [Candidatus Lindowbacteria bacterium RIFCSPLOWO2_12_FULL_62_27]|nr:MAG: hypothetical protein A3G34_00445 [Candidatus Lindowbacteria bacterium RIFCSPLOWO2_12_FULL_62_27]OGH63416.1 MAG: hypothetical protein A3I06_08525 [Candidatus Lindowbacteria bacterium RIFCSPLOWO2_02_FULL_62_12]
MRAVKGQVELVVRMCRKVLAKESVHGQLMEICREIRRHFGFSRVVIFLVDEVLRQIRGAAGSGLRLTYIRSQAFPIENRGGIEIPNAISRCAATGRPETCRLRIADAGYRKFVRGKSPLNRTYAKEYALLPLKVRGRTFAVIAVSVMEGEGTLTDETVATLASFADFVSLVILQAKELQERRRLEREIESVSEQIQRRLGQDFHDGLGQDLTGIRMRAELMEERLNGVSAEAAADAQRIVKLARQAVERARKLSRGLYPVTLERHGLLSALQELADSATLMYGIRCSVSAPRRIDIRKSTTAIQLYRIAQESVHNAVKHGRAGRVTVGLLRRKGRGVLEITDDGTGFDTHTKSTGMGLNVMRHRAELIDGELRIRAMRPSGTRVLCRFPLPSK